VRVLQVEALSSNPSSTKKRKKKKRMMNPSLGYYYLTGLRFELERKRLTSNQVFSLVYGLSSIFLVKRAAKG
jgi:hypothetical protein